MGRDGKSGGCGVRVGGSSCRCTEKAVREIADEVGGSGHQQLLVLFSKVHDAADLCTAIDQNFPDTPYIGCMTAGEIGPLGTMDDGIVIVAFPQAGFRICTEAIEDIRNYGFERANEMVRKLRMRLVSDRGTSMTAANGTLTATFEPQPRPQPPFAVLRDGPVPPTGAKSAGSAQASPSLQDRVFGILLVDGLSNVEENLISSINWAMGDLPLVGGSSGDRLGFDKTVLIHDGRILCGAAILMLVESAYPFAAFNSHNFNATHHKLVVTAADPENRVVYELNAENAAAEYARCIGLVPDRLDPFSFASHPLVVKVGDEYYCRSIRRIGEGGSLEFFCAIDEGLVLTVAEPGDIVNETLKTFQDLENRLGRLDIVIAFECILRRLDSENRQVRHLLEDTYRKYNIVGFQTYGEQLNAMHLNQTLTGIAFGTHSRG